MPTFTAIAFDRLIEPRESKSVDMPVATLKHVKSRPGPPPHPNSKLERRNSTPVERRINRPQIKPALYATPETTTLPASDSPSSFPPSPYIVNHKRRGPRLVKSFSVDDVASHQKAMDELGVNGSAAKSPETKDDSSLGGSVTFTIPNTNDDECEDEDCKGPENGKGPDNDDRTGPPVNERKNAVRFVEMEHVNGSLDGDLGGSNRSSGSSDISSSTAVKKEGVRFATSKSESETEDFYDPNESMSYTSYTDGEDTIGAESYAKNAATPMGEFFDAWDELSSESGPQPPSDIEAELREIRLNLLMEIEKRRQAEEALNDMQSRWQRIRQQLAEVGLRLPENLTDVAEGDQSDGDPAADLRQQFYLARFVSESIGRGIAKAEMEEEMDSQIEYKNFEIARLCDRLHYYEAMNREMSQRNQEALEVARRDRQKRRRHQKWVWGSIATAVTLGTAALAWSYFPSGKGSSTSDSRASTDGGDS